jgi:hypothetical protein
VLNYCLQSTLRFKDLHRGQDSQRKTPAAGRHEGGNLPRDARDQLSDVNRVTGTEMNIDRVSGIECMQSYSCSYASSAVSGFVVGFPLAFRWATLELLLGLCKLFTVAFEEVRIRFD